MAVAIYNVRTLAVKGRNGYGHAECALAKARQLDCDFVGLQETRELGKQSFRQQDIPSFLLWPRRNEKQARAVWSWLGW